MYNNIFIFCVTILTCINARTHHSKYFSFDDGTKESKYLVHDRSMDSGPPPHTEYAKVARYLVHRTDWTAMGTNSKKLPGFPMVNVVSIADSSRREKSTGNIYFYLTDLDFTGIDLAEDNRVTILLSQEQDLSCSHTNTDPMEPTCSRIILSGKVERLDNTSKEFDFATQAVQSRHPASKKWIVTHNFYLCKLMIENIILLDFYEGARYVSVTDYYNANYDWDTNDIEYSVYDDVQTMSRAQINRISHRNYDENEDRLDDNNNHKETHLIIDVIRIEQKS